MTLNQTLDQIFLSYQKKDMDKYPDVHTLKQKLIELKIKLGGNTKVNNEVKVKNIIRFGSANPEDWNQ